MLRILLLGLVGVASLGGIDMHEAAASPLTFWSAPAAGCVVDSRHTALANVNSQDGTVRFNTGQTGTIFLTCKVSGFQVTNAGCARHLGITASGTDGNTNPKAIAYLQAVGKSNGSGATLHSKAHDNNQSATPDYESTNITHTFDFDANYYWITIEIARSNTSQNPIVYGVDLGQTPSGSC
jgi:hypothetical protein